jgi:hypothetical protein
MRQGKATQIIASHCDGETPHDGDTLIPQYKEFNCNTLQPDAMCTATACEQIAERYASGLLRYSHLSDGMHISATRRKTILPYYGEVSLSQYMEYDRVIYSQRALCIATTRA